VQESKPSEANKEQVDLTAQEAEVFALFTRQLKMHLRTKSKKELITACVSLAIDNYNMQQRIKMLEKVDSNA